MDDLPGLFICQMKDKLEHPKETLNQKKVNYPWGLPIYLKKKTALPNIAFKFLNTHAFRRSGWNTLGDKKNDD